MLEGQTITYRPRWFWNSFLIPAVLVGVVIYWVGMNIFGLNWLFCLVLITQAILFFLLFKRPIWAMASLIVGQLTVSSFQFSLFGLPMSLRFFWAILALLVLLPVLNKRGKIKLGSRFWYVIIPVVIFFSLATISNLINTDLYTAWVYLREPAIVLVILLLLPATVIDDTDLKILSLTALITCSVSAMIALIQAYTPSTSPSIGLYEGVMTSMRVTGLSSSPFYLGYMFPVVLLPIVAMYFLKGVSSGIRILLILSFIIIAMGIYFSYTRSGIYSLIPGLLVTVFYMKSKPKKRLLLLSLIIIAVFFTFSFIIGNRFTQGFFFEESAAGRMVLWQAGLNIASDNPILGIGVGRFQEVSTAYTSTISLSTTQNLGAGGVLGVYSLHNDFLTIWSSFGIMALIVYLWILASIFINFLISYRHAKTRFFKGFTLGCIGAITTLIANSIVHNIMDSSMLIWIFGGLSIATTKIALSQR